MKRITCSVLTIFLFFQSLQTFSQIIFFTSNQEFTNDQLKSFYSSVTMDGDLILFNANDYKLYAYSKSTGKELWVSGIEYKTKRPCFVTDEFVFAPYYIDKQERTAMLDKKTGALVRVLGFGPLETKPFMKEGVLFGTAIYDGGAIFAYDVKKDSTLWWKFLAHGVSNQPYYFPGYIQANAEANNWVRINYNGQLLDTTCNEKADIFVNDIPCIRVFNALTHDGLELDERFSEKIFKDREAISPKNLLTSDHNSFILFDSELVILANKRKLQERINLASLVPDSVETDRVGLTQLVAANSQTIVFVYHDMLITYDHSKRKVVQMIDLAAWQPAQVLQDKNNIWLISKNNGLLYGLAF